jgi:hypothetical protein
MSRPFISKNPILFILAISLASKAFKDYNTVDNIFNIRALYCNYLILEWANYMLYMLIFRGLTLASPFRII